MRIQLSCSVLVLTVSCWCEARTGGPPPPPPQADYPLVDDLGYPDARAARAAWKAMWGTARVSVVEIDGRRALRMPCNFRGTRIERASWDRTVSLDLTACQGLQFAFFLSDVKAVSGLSLYMRSGNGWYAARFAPTAKEGWGLVEIDKTNTRMEGKPGGWGTIDTIRISAWRGRDTDTQLYIAGLGLLGADAPITIVRGESVTQNSPEEVRSATLYSRNVAQALDALGLSYAVISDLDVTAERLKDKKIAILPHNPSMPDRVADEIASFIDGGGKLVAFYVLPRKLGEQVGIRGGRHIRQTYRGHFASIRATDRGLRGCPPVVKQMSWNIRRAVPVQGRSRVAAVWHDDKGESTGEPAIVFSDDCVFMSHVLLEDDMPSKHRMLLAMLGHFDPGLWEHAARARVDDIGRFGPFRGSREALDGIRLEARRAGLRDALGEVDAAEALGVEARRLLSDRSFPESIARADAAHRMTIRAYCAVQRPVRGEHRAWWCHSAFGPAGMEWDEAIRILAENGFTAILPNMCWGGTAYYKSNILPVAREVKEKGDQIARCVAACRKHGIECHVWKVNWNMSHRAPREFAERMRREGRTQVRFDGESVPRWLCPSHPVNQKLEIDAMIEVATKYDVHGIHFDYIRYPGPEFCFCEGCRERFEKAIGGNVRDWPAAVRRDGALGREWLDFRRANITRVVTAVSDAVRERRPDVRISAAVFRDWPVDRDRVGQDWKLWCERGYLDFVCPMDYAPNNVAFESMVTRQLSWAGKTPCYPGMGLSVWGPSRDVVKLIEQIRITRRLGTGGFTIFEYRAPEAREIAPLCGAGITRRR